MDKEDVIYIHSKIFLSHKSEILLFVATWMDLEGIILCDTSLTEKDKYYRTHLYVESNKTNKQNKTDSKIQRTIGWLLEGSEWQDGQNR